MAGVELKISPEQKAICEGNVCRIEFVPYCKKAGEVSETGRLCLETGKRCHRIVSQEGGEVFVFPGGKTAVNVENFPLLFDELF